MIARHRLVVVALGWLAIVAVGSTLVWTVVGHAGRGLGGGPEAVAASTAPSEAGIGEAAASSLGAAPEPVPTGTADPTSSGGTSQGGPSPGPGTVPAGEESSGGPGGDPGPTGSGDPTPPPTTGTPGAGPDQEPPASQAPPPQTQQQTWQGPAGRVVAACTGARIALVSAQPNNGWHVEVDNNGPEELSVHFELREHEDDDRVAARGLSEDEVEIHARCVGGSPSFQT